jgi:hypothetical protein
MPPRKGSRTPAPAPEPAANGRGTAHVVQATTEAVTKDTEHITFYGQRYRLAPKIGYMPMLDFAHAAASGAASDDRAGMDAMWQVLYRSFVLKPPCRRCDVCRGLPPDPKGCRNRVDGDDGPCGFCGPCSGTEADPDSCEQYDPGDWNDFHLACLDNAADEVDLWEVVQQVLEAVAARPTRRRSGSSPSGPTVSPSLKAPSSSREPPGVEGLVSVEELTKAHSAG